MGVTPARHVTAGCRHRNIAVTCDQAGQQFDLCIEDSGALCLRKLPHFVVRKADIVLQLSRHFGRGRFALSRCYNDSAIPFVQPARIFGRLIFAASFDLVEHRLNGRAHVGFAGRGRLGSTLEIFARHIDSNSMVVRTENLFPDIVAIWSKHPR